MSGFSHILLHHYGKGKEAPCRCLPRLVADAYYLLEVAVVGDEPPGLCRKTFVGGILQWQLNTAYYVANGFAYLSCQRISVLSEIAKVNCCFRLMKISFLFSTRSYVSHTLATWQNIQSRI